MSRCGSPARYSGSTSACTGPRFVASTWLRIWWGGRVVLLDRAGATRPLEPLFYLVLPVRETVLIVHSSRVMAYGVLASMGLDRAWAISQQQGGRWQ